jgi:hypothetical protein
MAPFTPNGFAHGNRSASNGRGPSNASSINLALDNMIRSQLKVSDPRNPKEIAQALLGYYKDLPQAAAITEEAQGLPFLQAPMAPAMLAPARPTSSDTEFTIAQNDVEKALIDLSTNPLTADIVPEMQGWGQSIRDAVEETGNAARQGLDPSQRDKVIAIRRQLGEYARMARFVGTLAPGMTQNYRRLGQGLDEVAAVSLVMLGEALASVGFAYGYYLLQVPLADLRQRRDAVIFALRNFSGGAQEAYGPDEWPRGINAYRLLYNWLEEQGQGDLRTLLVETEVARIMDTLIARAQNGTPEGLRALGVTAQLDLERFRRLAIVAPGALPRLPASVGGSGMPDLSPPLVSFLEALLLFADAFRPAGGLRLLRIARPAILFYGLYNPNLLERDTTLLDLIMIRGNLATLLDSLFPGGGVRGVVPQVLLDMLVTSLDRAIDLLSLGAEPGINTATEIRAATYWLIAVAIVAILSGTSYALPPVLAPAPAAAAAAPAAAAVPVPAGGAAPPAAPPAAGAVAPLVGGPAPNQVAPGVTAAIRAVRPGRGAQARQLHDQAAQYCNTLPHLEGTDDSLRRVLRRLTDTLSRTLGHAHWQTPEGHLVIREELMVQRSLERRWRDLVRTVAPEAGNQDTVFDWLQVVVHLAINLASLTLPGSDEPLETRILPPQFEETLAQIARRIG